jgi:predicted metal-dependent phosphotriesterase family hydrolase
MPKGRGGGLETNIIQVVHVEKEDDLKHLVRYLVEKGAFVNFRDCFGQTALHYAARYRNAVVAEQLVDSNENDVEVNRSITKIDGETASCLSIHLQSQATWNRLLSN